MAFNALLTGAECSTSNNPLSQFMKQANEDRSLQQDRFSGAPGGSGLRQFPSSSSSAGPVSAEAEAFFRSQPQHLGGPGPGGFEMEVMRRELESLHARPGPAQVPGRGGGAGWAQEFERSSPAPGPTSMAMRASPMQAVGANPAETVASFERSKAADGAAAWRSQFERELGAPSEQELSSAYARELNANASGLPFMGIQYGGMMGMNEFRGMGFGGLGMGAGMASQTGEGAALDKGKGRFVEVTDADWEAEFARASGEATTENNGKGKGKASEEENKEAEQADAKETDEDEDAAIRRALDSLDHPVDDDLTDLERAWLESGNRLPPRSAADTELAAWEGSRWAEENENAYTAFSHPGGGLGPGMAGLHESLRGDYGEEEYIEGYGTVLDDGFPILGTYRFTPDSSNPYLSLPAGRSALSEGLHILENRGSLGDASLAFEAAVKAAENKEGELGKRERSEAWRRLGEAHAANEKEVQAIRALEKAIEEDDENLQAYMSLAISYINEGYDVAAHSILERYIARAYPNIAVNARRDANALTVGLNDPNTANPWAQVTRVTDMFLAAARDGAKRGEMDPEVQVGLGVLYYSNASHDQARDCFEAALQSRPADFLLWNRLGATLANGGKPELAIDAYHKALELRPTFTRAIYNLSVSCLNLGAHHEAAEHLLAALSLQQTQHYPDAPEGEQNGEARPPPPLAEASESANLWSTLRRIFMAMDRMDLAQRATVGADLNQFRSDGFDF